MVVVVVVFSQHSHNALQRTIHEMLLSLGWDSKTPRRHDNRLLLFLLIATACCAYVFDALLPRLLGMVPVTSKRGRPSALKRGTHGRAPSWRLDTSTP